MTVEAAIRRRHRVLQPVSAVEQHHPVRPIDPAVGQGPSVGRVGGSSFWGEEQTFLVGYPLLGPVDVLVGDRDREPLAFPDGGQDQEVTDGGRYPDSGCNGVGLLPEFRMVGSLVVGADDGGTPGRLDGHHSRQSVR